MGAWHGEPGGLQKESCQENSENCLDATTTKLLNLGRRGIVLDHFLKAVHDSRGRLGVRGVKRVPKVLKRTP